MVPIGNWLFQFFDEVYTLQCLNLNEIRFIIADKGLNIRSVMYDHVLLWNRNKKKIHHRYFNMKVETKHKAEKARVPGMK